MPFVCLEAALRSCLSLSYVSQMDQYPSCSTRRTYVSYIPKGDFLYDVLASLKSSCALEAMFLFEALIPSLCLVHPLS